MNIDEGIRIINYVAENAHRKHLPSGIGFGLILAYHETLEEAADFIAANYPKKVSGFPMIQAAAKATSMTAHAIADNIIKERAKWIKMAAKIEGYRLAALKHMEEPDADIDTIVKHTISHLDKLM